MTRLEKHQQTARQAAAKTMTPAEVHAARRNAANTAAEAANAAVQAARRARQPARRQQKQRNTPTPRSSTQRQQKKQPTTANAARRAATDATWEAAKAWSRAAAAAHAA